MPMRSQWCTFCHLLVCGSLLMYPRVERKDLTTFARRNKVCFSFLLYIFKLGLSPEIPTQYSETRTIARVKSTEI